MTDRQWKIYNAIKEAGEEGIGQKALCQASGLTYAPSATNCKNDDRGDHCKQLAKEIDAINASPEVEKTIVTNHYRYKLGSEEECLAYCSKLRERAIRILRREGQIMSKIRKNGQGKLVSCQGRQIDGKSKARGFVEAFPCE